MEGLSGGKAGRIEDSQEAEREGAGGWGVGLHPSKPRPQRPFPSHQDLPHRDFMFQLPSKTPASKCVYYIYI